MTYTYINQINPSPRVKQENQKRFIITCCPFKEIDRKKTPSTKIAKMGDCNDSSSHGDSSLSSDSDAEYQVESGKTREPQTRKTSKQLRYYYRKTAGRTKRTYTPFADQENPSKQLKCYHATKECESATVSAEHDLSLEIDDTGDNTIAYDENDVVFDDLQTDADELNMTSSSDDLVTSASDESMSEIESREEDLQHQIQEENEASASIRETEEPLYEGSKISKVLSFVLIVSFVLKHNLSKAAWADLLNLLTVLLGERCKKTFQSVYKMKLSMREYFGSKEPTKINYCANCFNQVEDRCHKAGRCSGAPVSSFLDLHFEEKIKDLFKDSEFLRLLKKGKEQIRSAASNTIHDIYHGLDYKNFLHPGGFLGSQPYNISFTLNTDGVNKYSSSTAGHLWPVYLMINELPKEHRFRKKFIIPAYIYCDKHDPNMLTFLNPLVEKLNSFYETGIHVPRSGDGDITVRCMLFVATADLPARAALMNMKQFNGKCACHLCKSEGTAYGQHNIHRCWPFKQNHEKRTHEDQINFAMKATQKQAVMGVKGYSTFAKLLYPFDLVRSFAVDWMHCVYLGVVKYIMTLQLSEGNKDKDFYIGSSKACLSHRLLSIKPPDIVGRLPRSLDDLKHWKATEFKNWLLHYSVAVLRPVLNPLYLFHWTLLVGGIGILCSDSIVKDDLSSADSMLQDFVLLMGILFAPTKCTMNVHLLQHFAYYVSRRGPIWAYSCFAFEGMNAFIKPLVHGTHHAMEQIGCAIGLCFGLTNFTKDVLANANVPKDSKRLIRSLTGFSKSNYKTSSRIAGGYLCGKHSNIDSDILTLVKVHVIINRWPKDYEVEAYRRFESDEGQKFYSSLAKTWKTNSTVIEYTENCSVCYGRVKIFLKLNGKAICVCDKLEETFDNVRFNKRDCDASLRSLSVSDDDRNRVSAILQRYHDKRLVNHHVYVKPSFGGPVIIQVEQIRRKCVFIDISTDAWIFQLMHG